MILSIVANAGMGKRRVQGKLIVLKVMMCFVTNWQVIEKENVNYKQDTPWVRQKLHRLLKCFSKLDMWASTWGIPCHYYLEMVVFVVVRSYLWIWFKVITASIITKWIGDISPSVSDWANVWIIFKLSFKQLILCHWITTFFCKWNKARCEDRRQGTYVEEGASPNIIAELGWRRKSFQWRCLSKNTTFCT